MSILPTSAPFSAATRPRSSWSIDMPSAVSCAPVASDVVMNIAEFQDSVGHIGTNHDTTGSKRLRTGHLSEVST